MPRIMTMTYPMEIVMNAQQVNVFAEWNGQTRRICERLRQLIAAADPQAPSLTRIADAIAKGRAALAAAPPPWPRAGPDGPAPPPCRSAPSPSNFFSKASS